MSLRVAAGLEPSLDFRDPVRVWTPLSFEGALAALKSAQDALRDGYWIAGALRYEFGAALHGIAAHPSPLPLLVLGAFEKPHRLDWNERDAPFAMSAPLARVPYDAYAASIAQLLQRIADGEVYQVNYTVPFDVALRGDPFDLYRFLARRSRTPYCAFLQHEEFAIASFSPELFLRFEGERVVAKPMKGTAALTHIDDLENAKNRAEHVMIVDLLRNDLRRICTQVRVERLYDVEHYPTFATMTSTIAGRLERGVDAERILRATFPCGSVTGAPKRAAMQQIAAIEPQARGFYTGSIGFLSPRRRGWWNVPIRTLQFTHGAGRFDAGGGIVSDSRADDEWREIGVKARFLAPAHASFALLETMRGGPEPSDLDAHVRRLCESAAAFGIPVQRDAIRAQIVRAAASPRALLLRLRVSAGGMHLQTEALGEPEQPILVCFSPLRVDSHNPLLGHKTNWRPVHDAALRQARERGCFDAVLRNERGEITEGARTTLFAQIGKRLYTPPLACGVLPGILRSRLVSNGQAFERVLFEEDLTRAQALYAGNSARGLLRAKLG